jgi:2-oxo-4-hydroxy-4-carboxy--5-ureidoimidazoline (OHCU) decarboxylase
VAGRRPFDSLYAMRHAIHSVLFEAPVEQAKELVAQYPELAAQAVYAATP